MEPKCEECKWYVIKGIWKTPTCLHGDSLFYVHLKRERTDSGVCGPTGALFEPKQPKEDKP